MLPPLGNGIPTWEGPQMLIPWVNRTITFAGKTIPLKHILCAILIFHFMSMTINVDGFWMLEGICHNFLQGKNKVGNQKRVLAAWKNIACNKAKGGLGIEPFAKQSKMCHMCWLTKILLELDISQVLLTHANIHQCLASGPGYMTKHNWMAVEGLLLENELYVTTLPFLRELICGFQLASKSQVLCEDNSMLPTHLSIEQLLLLFKAK